MRILYLAHRIPYPPNKGDKIRSYHHLRHLAARHEVHLLAFVDDPADEQWTSTMSRLCTSVALVPLDRRVALARGLASLARGRSLSEGYFGARQMQRAAAASSRLGIDVAWGFSSVMAQYLSEVRAGRCVVDLVDVDSEKWLQFSREAPLPPLRWLYGLEGARLRTLEREIAAQADCALFVTEGEAALFRSFAGAGGDVRVVANGVDGEYFRRRSGCDGPPVMLFTGALDYKPNVDAVLWFAREVLPLVRGEVPEARLLAVGHRPALRLRRAAEARNGTLQIAGSVPDVRPYFEQSQVYVAPLRLGRGVQNKVLEAMAMEVPVVASPLAVSGLGQDAAANTLVAESARQFADAAVALLREPERRRRLAEKARRWVEVHASWSANLATLDACLEPRSPSAAAAGERWTASSA